MLFVKIVMKMARKSLYFHVMKCIISTINVLWIGCNWTWHVHFVVSIFQKSKNKKKMKVKIISNMMKNNKIMCHLIMQLLHIKILIWKKKIYNQTNNNTNNTKIIKFKLHRAKLMNRKYKFYKIYANFLVQNNSFRNF